MEIETMRNYILITAQYCHTAAVEAGWWTSTDDGSSLIGKRDFIAMCGLIVTEITEAHDGYLLSANDDKLPHRLQAEVELADAFIRMGDTTFGNNVDLASAMSSIDSSFNPYPNSERIFSFADRLMTVVGFISYAIEGHRKRDAQKTAENMAKAMIAVLVLSAMYGYDLRGAVAEKMAFNKVRPDHKMENRMKEGGKKE